MANNLDPNDQTQAPPPQGVSTDASNPSTLKSMWDAWTSRPENNAAMINFGLNMMQPITAGQSVLGHLGESIGAGAEASQRSVASQRAQEQEDIGTELKEREEARKERETGYYGQIASRAGTGGASAFNLMMKARMARSADFSDWLTGKGSKYTGEDNIFDAIKQQFPKIKTKADLQKPENRDAFAAAQQMHSRSHPLESYDVGQGAEGGGGNVNDAALQWARQNPRDPRAKAIMQQLGTAGAGEE